MEVVQYLRSNGYSEDYIDHFKETGLSMKFKRNNFLPPGWREAVTSNDGCKGGVLTQRRYMSPDGTILQSRVNTIKYMMDNLFERSHIETMISLLKSKDGWQYDMFDEVVLSLLSFTQSLFKWDPLLDPDPGF